MAQPRDVLPNEDFEVLDLEIVESVPVFEEHSAELNYDLPTLQKIVAINNERYLTEPAVVIIGHQDDSNDEKPAIGFMDRLTLGVRNGVNTLFGRFKIYKDKLEELKTYPKRSVEIVLATLVIDAVALLGGNTPALELGVLYKKSKTKVLHKASKQGAPMAVSEELQQQILEVLAQTDMYAWVKAQMDAQQEEVQDEEASNDEEKQEFSEEEQKEDEPQTAEDASDEKPEDEPEEDKPEQSKDEPKEDDQPKDEDKEGKQKYSKLEKEHSDLKALYKKAQREKKLMVLAGEGHCFDIDEELNDTLELNDTAFDKHLSRLQRVSKKAPIKQNFKVARISTGGTVAQPSAADLAQVSARAHKDKISFQEAYKLHFQN